MRLGTSFSHPHTIGNFLRFCCNMKVRLDSSVVLCCLQRARPLFVFFHLRPCSHRMPRAADPIKLRSAPDRYVALTCLSIIPLSIRGQAAHRATASAGEIVLQQPSNHCNTTCTPHSTNHRLRAAPKVSPPTPTPCYLPSLIYLPLPHQQSTTPHHALAFLPSN